MLGLRWTLGVLTAAAALGWLAFAIVAGGFRRSFGASDNGLVTVLPPLAGALILSSLVWPERRILLHVVAALMVVILAGAVWVARETAFVATLGVAYASTWLYLYWRLLRA